MLKDLAEADYSVPLLVLHEHLLRYGSTDAFSMLREKDPQDQRHKRARHHLPESVSDTRRRFD